MKKLSVVGICLIVVSIITGVVTGNGLFTIPMLLGLIFVFVDLFTYEPEKNKG